MDVLRVTSLDGLEVTTIDEGKWTCISPQTLAITYMIKRHCTDMLLMSCTWLSPMVMVVTRTAMDRMRTTVAVIRKTVDVIQMVEDVIWLHSRNPLKLYQCSSLDRMNKMVNRRETVLQRGMTIGHPVLFPNLHVSEVDVRSQTCHPETISTLPFATVVLIYGRMSILSCPWPCELDFS